MSLFLLSSSWKVLEDEQGENYFYNPDADKAVLEDALQNVKDKTIFSHVQREPLMGSICIELIHANLIALGEDDWFCTVLVDDGDEKLLQKYKSQTKKKTDFPEWKERFDIKLNGGRMVLLKIWRQNTFGAKLAAQCIFSVRQYCDGVNNRLLYSLTPGGEIKFSIQYNSLHNVLNRRISFSSCKYVDKVFKCEMEATEYTSYVPIFIVLALQIIEKDPTIEGLYRVNGSKSEMKTLKSKISKYSVKRQDYYPLLSNADVHVVCGLVKEYFRELPEPLLDDAVYESITAAITGGDLQQDAICIIVSTILAGMEVVNAATAYVLLEHIYQISKYSDENKMTRTNLATVFGPTLLANPMTKMTIRSGTADTIMQTKILEAVLNNWKGIKTLYLEKTGLSAHIIKATEDSR